MLEFQINAYYDSNAILKGVRQSISKTDLCINGDNYFRDLSDNRFAAWEDQDFTTTLFGRTATGESVCLVCKTYPAFMVQLPENADSSDVDAIAAFVRKKQRLREGDMFHEFQQLHKAGGFHPDLNSAEPKFARFPFMRLYFRTQGLFYTCRKLFWKDEQKSVRLEISLTRQYVVELIEQKVTPILQFLEHCKIKPSSVVRIDEKHLRTLPDKVSHCKIEKRCKVLPWANPIELVEDVADIFPLIVTSFDIECVAPSGGFPNPDVDDNVIICIANTTKNFKTKEQVQVVHGLEAYDDFPTDDKVKCYKYDTELELLEGWRDSLVLEEDPDIITGYNIDRFDWNYMHERAMKLDPQSRFFFFSKLIRVPCKFTDRMFESKAYGASENKRFDIPGRINFDLFTYIKRGYKLDNYKLSTVAKHFLHDDKDPLSIPLMISYWLSRDPHKRYLIMKYCVKDTILPINLLETLMIVPAVVEMSRVTNVFLADLFNRGQMFKVWCQLYIFARSRGFALTGLPDYVELGLDTYQGATVLDVTPGFYKNLVVLDFAALYPSIMIAWNLCYASWVREEKYAALANFQYFEKKTDLGTFKFQQTLPGLLPQMAKALLAARSKAKKKMKAAKKAGDTELAAIYNGRQLALKISTNSIYGFTGAAKQGMYACPPIACTTTAQGRELIDDTKRFAEQEHGAIVVAGDTDSVFMQFPHLPDTKEGFLQAFDLGERVGDAISAKFPEAIILEFEKVYNPGLLMKKKRYVGLKYETKTDPGNIDAKGVALVRRDFCHFQRDTFLAVVNKILLEQDIAGSLEVLAAQFQSLVDKEVAFEKLILTRLLAKEYKNENQMQKVVAEKIEARTPGLGPKPGDRVLFVAIVLKTGHKKAALYQKVEDAEYARERKLPLDLQHYMTGLRSSMDTMYQCFDLKTRNRVNDIFAHFSAICYRVMFGYKDMTHFFQRTSSSSSSALTIASVAPKRKKKKRNGAVPENNTLMESFFKRQK
jgi:DNA polymerase delta subunit 1